MTKTTQTFKASKAPRTRPAVEHVAGEKLGTAKLEKSAASSRVGHANTDKSGEQNLSAAAPRGLTRPLSDADWQLLALLEVNARLSVAELAQTLGLARTTVQARLKRLEATGVIAGYTVRLSQRERIARVNAHVLLEVDAKKTSSTIRALKDLPQVRAVHSVSGPFDYVALVQEQSVDRLDEVLDRLGALEGVIRTQSLVVLSTKFER